MSFPIWILSIAIAAVIYLLVPRPKNQTVPQGSEHVDCRPLKCLPNKWFPPFGLDKLAKVTEAEKARKYPMLMLHDHEKHGDTYAQWGGPIYTIITRDISNIRAILSRDFKSFEIGSGRHGCVRPLLGDGIFTQDGHEWEASRKLLAPMIQRPTLPDLNLIEKHFQLLQDAIHLDRRSGAGAVDMKKHLIELSLRLTTEFLLGEALDSTGDRATQWMDRFATQFNTAFRWIAKRERLKVFYWMVDGLEFRRTCSAAKRLVDDVVRQALEKRKATKQPNESYVALETLLQEDREPERIRDQFMNLLLAGRDTSGALLCWVFYVLAREPVVMAELREEIREVLGSDQGTVPSKSELNSMGKLDQFICETLRLFPPVPINGRFSVQPTTLPRGGGQDGDAPVIVPSGTLIAFSTFAAQRNKELYGPDADRFVMSRWSDRVTKERRMVDWSFHPFLGGPRKCLGERFAVTQAKYLTCRTLQHYSSLEPTDEVGNSIASSADGSWVDEVKFDVGLTMMPDANVWVKFSPDE